MGRALPKLEGLPRAFWALWLGTLVNRIGGFVVPFLAVYLTDQRHLSVERTGLVLALFGAGSLVAALVGGALADRFGRKRTAALAFCFGSAAMLHLGLARDGAHIAVAAFALGLLGDMYRPASQALVADLVAPEDRTRAYALQYWAVNLGFSVSPLIAGLLAADKFMLLFVGDAASTLACAAIIAFAVPEMRGRRDRSERERLDYLAPYRDAPFVTFLTLAFVLGVVFQQWISTMPIHMRSKGITPATFGALFAINGVLIVLIQPFVVEPLRRFRRERVLSLGALLCGLGFGVNAIATTPVGFGAGIAVWTLGEIATVPVLSTVVAAVAPPQLRGSYQGAFGVSFSAATLVAPALGSWIYGALGASVLWNVCVAAACAVAVGYLLIGNVLEKRVAAAGVA